MDYWLDIIPRSSNPCYYRDIRTIEERIRRAREQVRSSFLRCDLQNLDNLTEAYHRLEAELYFLRHAVIKNDEGIFVVSRLNTEAEKRELAKEMKKFFVIDRGLISDEQMLNYVNIFSAKYEGRAEDYNNCRSEIYGDIEEKLITFWEQIKSLGSEFATAFTEGTPSRRGNPPNAPNATEGSQTSRNALLDRLYGIVDFAEVEPETELSDLTEALDPTENLPTFENVRFTLERASERFSTQTSRADLLKKYEVLYGNIADDAVSKILQKQDRLIEILKATSPAMEEATSCVENVEDRECRNS